jgi:branched-subunit amino acid transport protein
VKTEVVSQGVIWAVIVGMALSNFVVCFVPIAVMSRMAMPKPLMRWLSFVPVSVMGALVAGEVLRPGGVWSNPFTGPSLYAAIVTALTFHFSRSFLGATVAGMASFVALQHLLPLVVR